MKKEGYVGTYGCLAGFSDPRDTAAARDFCWSTAAIDRSLFSAAMPSMPRGTDVTARPKQDGEHANKTPATCVAHSIVETVQWIYSAS